MATEVGSAFLTILPSARGFGKALSGGIDPEMGAAGRSAGSKFGSGLGSSAKGIGKASGILMGGALVAAVGAAIGGIGAIIKTGFDESKDASKGTAQLAAGIKSTGNAAGVSVKGLNSLASSIQNYSGQTDDSIVAAEGLLLTFTNIKNKGPDKLFDQATTAAANMAARFGGDASGSAIQLGKALQDPIKGISSLARVGVIFDAGQKKSIKAMVDAGDTMGAQKVVLAELNKEFGGSAKAAGESLPGQMAIAKRSFEDLSQTVVTGLLPAFTTTLSGINSFIGDTRASFEKGGLSQVFTDLGAKISAALPGIQAQLGKWGTALWAWVQDAVPPLMVKLGELWVKLETWIWGTALPAIAAKLVSWGKAFVEWIAPMIPPFLAKLGDLLVIFGNWILNTGLPKLGAQLKEWGKAFWAWIGPMIPPVLLALGGLLLKLGWWLLSVALPRIVSTLVQWSWAMHEWVPAAAIALLGALGGLLSKLGTWFVATAFPKIVGWFAGLPSRIASVSAGMWDGIKTAFRGVINWLIGKWNDFRLTIGGGTFFGKNIPSITLDTPNIPMLAAGGIVPATPGGRLVRVAEGGQDEAIVPLGKGAGIGDTHNWYVTGATPEALYMQFSRRQSALGAV